MSHQPKPDFWFGLGIYSDEQLFRLKGLEFKDKGIRYFTQESLKQMSRKYPDEFVYQPVKSMEYGAFPWMVVELKKEFGDESECLRQAANACHTSLVLCERLAAPAARDASPIVALTSIGPEAKLFIAYKSEDADDKCYVCSSLSFRYRFLCRHSLLTVLFTLADVLYMEWPPSKHITRCSTSVYR